MNLHILHLKSQPKFCPLPCGDFSVELAAPGGASLFQLAEAMLKAIGFDNDHAFGFYDNLKSIYDSTEAYTIFADIGDDEGAKPVSKTTVGEAFHTPGKQFMFLFDYGDNWQFLVTCLEIKPNEKPRKTIKAGLKTGTPPKQYPGME